MLNITLLDAVTHQVEKNGDSSNIFYLILIAIVAVVLIVFIIKYIKNGGDGMLISGSVIAVGGFIATIYGAIQRDTVEYKLGSVFGAEEVETIDTIFYIGIAALALGLVFLTLYLVKKTRK